MATEGPPFGLWRLSRRAWLLGGLGGVAGAASGATAPTLTWATTWLQDSQPMLGLLRRDAQGLHILASLALPTRAHGLVAEPGGSVLVAGRRPGDWLLRWHPRSGRCTWAWCDPGEVLNGHVLRLQGGRHVLTSGTDLDSGQGLLQWRDAASLRVLARWRSGGRDPHALLQHAGRLWVAHGGIPTQPETGRVKQNLAAMDSSLVALDPANGRRQGQWRVADPRLSLRHLAANGGLIGVAMQAEHDDADQRARAPLLAVFDGQALRCIEPDATHGPTGGYGGDIAALGRGFALSATRGHRVLTWSPDTGHGPGLPLREAGALVAGRGGKVLAAGLGQVQDLGAPSLATATDLRLDNHGVAL